MSDGNSQIVWERMTKLFENETDFVKHIATLDTAAIVVIASLLDKFTTAASAKFLVQISFGGFAVSIIAVVLHHFSVLAMHYYLVSSPKWIMTEQDKSGDISIGKLIKPVMRGYWSSLLFSLVGFLIGLMAIVLFAWENLN